MNVLKTSDAALKVAWEYFYYTILPANSVILHKVVVPYMYEGVVAAGELLVYSATKAYFAIEIEAEKTTGAETTPPRIDFRNLADAVHFNYGPQSAYWDATAAAVKYVHNAHGCKNVWFSRMEIFNFIYVKFIGFKITW